MRESAAVTNYYTKNCGDIVAAHSQSCIFAAL